MIHLKTCTIRCLITNAIFHAHKIRWFLKQFWVIMSTGMGYLSKYRIQTISNSMEIGTVFPKITQQNLNFPLSALRSPLYAHILKSPYPLPLTCHPHPPSLQPLLPRLFCLLFLLPLPKPPFQFFNVFVLSPPCRVGKTSSKS
jgi:hypothetical protein